MPQPNIVLITTDQHRADHTTGYGFDLDTMPFLDSLARGGRRFHRAYTTSPACVPARTSLLTGRFPTATRVRQNSTGRHVVRGDDLLDVLGAAGYRLLFSGKPHMYRNDPAEWDRYDGPYMHDHGPRPQPSAEDEAFESWLTALDHRVSTEPAPFPVQRQFAHRATTSAIEHTREAASSSSEDGAAGRPFFCWVSFPEPHNPYQAPEPYHSWFSPDDVPDRQSGPSDAVRKDGDFRWLRELIERKRPGYDDDWRRYRALYCGMLRMLDDQVRRLVEHLQAIGQWENTILVFTADHGDYVGEYGLQRKGAGMPECLMRVPLVVTGPGIAPAEDHAHFCGLADLFPTICEAADLPIPPGVQGRSLWPVLSDEPSDASSHAAQEFRSIYAERGFGGESYGPEEHPPLHFDDEGPTFDELNTVTQSGSTRMLRLEQYKLLFDEAGRAELYDLEADPTELHDRYADPDYRDVRERATAELLRWCIRVNDPLPAGVYTPKRYPHNWALPGPGGDPR